MTKVSGFVIVEKSSEIKYRFRNHTEPQLLRINGSTYCGIGRQWGIEYFDDSRINDIVEKAYEVYSNTLMYKVIDSIDSAELLLNQVNLHEDIQHEIIAINNKSINDFMGLIDLPDDYLRFGIDIESEYSCPIKEDLFCRKINNTMIAELETYLKKLNKFGLFESEIDAMDFVKKYVEVQKSYNLEPMTLNQIELIEIFGKQEKL